MLIPTETIQLFLYFISRWDPCLIHQHKDLLNYDRTKFELVFLSHMWRLHVHWRISIRSDIRQHQQPDPNLHRCWGTTYNIGSPWGLETVKCTLIVHHVSRSLPPWIGHRKNSSPGKVQIVLRKIFMLADCCSVLWSSILRSAIKIISLNKKTPLLSGSVR